MPSPLTDGARLSENDPIYDGPLAQQNLKALFSWCEDSSSPRDGLRRALQLTTLFLVLSFPFLPSFGQNQSETFSLPLDLHSSQARQFSFGAGLRSDFLSVPLNVVTDATLLHISEPLPVHALFAPSAAPVKTTLQLRTDSCSSPIQIGLISACPTSPVPRFTVTGDKFDFYFVKPIQPAPRPNERFHWKSALWQSFDFLVVGHAFRLANDPGARDLLFHKPFWHDYLASADNFHMSRWGDGDDFLVNYIGHPMEGAVYGDIYLNNDPKGRSARFGRSSNYWYSRLKAMAWATVWEAYFEIGPVFSEAAIGNEGGYTYVPGCGLYPCDKYPGKNFKPPTNNTGWVDFVITPTVGMGWIVLEDAIEVKIVDRIAKGSPALKYKILRGSLAPSHTFANLFAGKAPWFRYPQEGSFTQTFGVPLHPAERPKWKDEPRYSLGVQFISMKLPLDSESCSSCKQFLPGYGFDFNYRFAKYAYFDSVVNLFPGSISHGEHGGGQEGLIGLKLGSALGKWGLFSNIRSGFIHYDKSLVPGSTTAYQSTWRYALDFGGAVEYSAARSSTFRLNAGTTLIHYLQGYSDPNQPPTSVISTQYYSFRGSPYLSSGYIFRF
jgi:hypothetical protein